MSGGRHKAAMTQEGGGRAPSDSGGKKSKAHSRTSMSGLLPSPMVWGDQPPLPPLIHNGGPRRPRDTYDGGGVGRYGAENGGRGSLVNGERSSDSEDSGATSGATSGKEASPGYEESSGSEQEPPPSPRAPRPSLPRSSTTPLLNGDHSLDAALRPLTHYGGDPAPGEAARAASLNRIRAAHEANVSKLAYLEALFQRARMGGGPGTGTGPPIPTQHTRHTPRQPRSLASPETPYKTLPSSISEYSLRTSVGGVGIGSGGSGGSGLPDGQSLLRTIENRLSLARPQEPGGGVVRSLYQSGGSSSLGSLTRLAGPPTPPSGPATPARFLSPSRNDPPAPGLPGSAPLKRPDVLAGSGSGVTGGHVSQRSLPHSYRSRSAYSSPAVSPQRGPDPAGPLLSPSGSGPRRFSSLELRGRGNAGGGGAGGGGSAWGLPLRHTTHGLPTAVLPISPPSPACGTQAFTRKMQLFCDILDTQSRLSQDLQSEIESHKDVLASLNATGQKLLGTLDNQEEAVMLQRRLHEMNQRWNTLKHKSIAIRNRLEGNSENWNSLLLSLRELIEWVIRKDTELTGLGPAVGDLTSLAKYTDDLASFRRVIDEKQPVIESNLKSGRQLVASEPPLSDTSDSEAGRDLDSDLRYRGGDDAAREVTRSVRREVTKLSDKWAALRERAANTAGQADLAHKKLGVLQKTVEDVSNRMAEAERSVESWGPVPQDSNLADQHAHNVRKLRENLADLQRGVDDVNDQAARFSAHNVPLTPANSARLHDLNNRWKILESCVNERWRAVAGRSREVTPVTPAQLASSVSPPWERATTPSKVPYYINHEQESTHWDHPAMMELLDSLTEFNHIKFSAYRTATKLRLLQKKLALDRAKMQTATDIFDEHGLRGQNDRLIDVSDMLVVLSALYASIGDEHSDVDTTLAMDLCLNWLLNVYDSQRTGQMRVLSFKIGLVCLCTGHLEEKYRYMFRLIADPNRLADQRKLGLLLHDCVQVPRQLGEVAAFGGSNIEPSVRSCFTKAGKDRETIEAVHFLAWVQQEPQSLVWLAVLHRVAASETIQHQVKCNICKAYPILGLRYRCLKCLSFDMCQRCFFDGRSGKSHKITHPMHEYCTATTTGEDMKDFTKALKNKFKSKRSLQKHTKKGYLPVQTVLEGDPLESPSPSPQHNVTSQDMHSRLELYASRLAEVELRTNSNSTPDSEDEHGLIAQYCQSLSSSDAPLPVPRSPLQVMAAVDAEQKDELEQMIRALEEENSVLQAEYDRLKSQQPVGSPPDDGPGGGGGQRSEAEMIAEAKLLRQHKGRLEARMGILEEHNRQLEAQLHRLRQLLGEPGGMSSPNKSGTLQTKAVTASQLAMDSPAKINGHSTQGELGKVVGTLVATMTHEQEKDWPSEDQRHTHRKQDEEEEEEDEEEEDEDEEEDDDDDEEEEGSLRRIPQDRRKKPE